MAGWKVVEKEGRPIEQFRDKYYANMHGMFYEFPPTVTKKRKRQTQNPAAVEFNNMPESGRKRVDTGSTKVETPRTDAMDIGGEPSSPSSSEAPYEEVGTVRNGPFRNQMFALPIPTLYARVPTRFYVFGIHKELFRSFLFRKSERDLTHSTFSW